MTLVLILGEKNSFPGVYYWFTTLP